ncbi:MAG: nucleotidyltransferase domain-containing protein [Oscillospiraceae bacterium]
MLDKATVVNAVEQYAQAVTREFKPHSILLYGSYAKGNAGDESDIDVAVVFNGYKGEWLKDSARLWKLAFEVNHDIEPILVDSTKDPSGFVADIFKTGQVIYRA